jgi:hypothetical protein
MVWKQNGYDAASIAFGTFIQTEDQQTANAMVFNAGSTNEILVLSGDTAYTYVEVNADILRVYGDLDVTGTKNRLVQTEDYGQRRLAAYETPTPMFGDVGEGVIGEDGLCYVSIEPVFAQTIVTNGYQVFLQKYGEGDIWVKDRRGGWFIVEGTPGMAFGWEIKARQMGYEQRRMDKKGDGYRMPKASYGEDAARHINTLTKGRISA